MIKITSSLRKRFVKDYNLPITLLEDPYFLYFIDLYTHIHARIERRQGSHREYPRSEKYDCFVDLVSRLGNEEKFFSESKRIIDDMIESVITSENYKEFQSFDINNKIKLAHNFEKHSPIFKEDYDKRWFTSIDLVKANWQALKTFNPAIVQSKKSYEEWALQFTNEKYFLNSKQIRQVIFGNLNPKRQQSIQRYLIDQAWTKLELEFDIQGATSDEIIVYHRDKPSEQILSLIKSLLPFEFDFHVKTFQLFKIEDKPFYKRVYLDNSFDLRGVPSHYYAEVIRHIRNEECTEFDRTTLYDERIVRFIEPLFI